MQRVSDEWIAAYLADDDCADTATGEAIAELQRWRQVEQRLRESAKARNAFAQNLLLLIDVDLEPTDNHAAEE